MIVFIVIYYYFYHDLLVNDMTFHFTVHCWQRIIQKINVRFSVNSPETNIVYHEVLSVISWVGL